MGLGGLFTQAAGIIIAHHTEAELRKRAETALRSSEQRYRMLFESMDEAYAVVEVLKGEDGKWRISASSK